MRTSHGHHIPGTDPGGGPDQMKNCGGVNACLQCDKEAISARRSAKQEVVEAELDRLAEQESEPTRPWLVRPGHIGGTIAAINSLRNEWGDEAIDEALAKGINDIVSPDAPTTTNEHGGSQSHIPVRFDLIDAKAMFEMAKVLHVGAEKYGEDNWRLIPIRDHLNHLLMHTYAYLAGDITDEHLSHILCRATFAMGVACAEEGEE